jgi:hypothetical protein
MGTANKWELRQPDIMPGCDPSIVAILGAVDNAFSYA